MSIPEEHHAEGGIDLERIIFFSDAVFAISITLLVLDIRVPEDIQSNLPIEVANAALLNAVSGLWPSILSYVISFLVIGLYWVAHHRSFRFIRRYDGRLIWLNLLFLMSVAFIPFPTALIGKYGDAYWVSVVIYACSLGFAGLLLTLTWLYAATGHRLIDEELDSRLIRYYALRSLIPAVIFPLSLTILLVNPQFTTLTELSWLSVALIRTILNRIYRLGPS